MSDATRALWDTLRHLLNCLLQIFGSPEELVADRVLGRKHRAGLIAWLGALEALARRLLLIDAGAGVQRAPAARARAPRPRRRGVVEQAPDDPQSWRVQFRAMPAAPRARAARPRRAGPGLGQGDPWPLAERLEALLRVVVNPAPYAARLAARLRARPEAALRLAAAPQARGSPRFDDEWEQAGALLPAALAAFPAPDTG